MKASVFARSQSSAIGMTHRRSHGFTLPELLLVVTVVAVLGAIALPSYNQHVLRANRTAAQRYMMDVADRQEQYLNSMRAYTTAVDSTGLTFPPPSELGTRYDFTIVVNHACCGPNPNWQITAAPKGPQAGDVTLVLDSRGAKSPADKW
jgi:type IV pilus assembly protein PilE